MIPLPTDDKSLLKEHQFYAKKLASKSTVKDVWTKCMDIDLTEIFNLHNLLKLIVVIFVLSISFRIIRLYLRRRASKERVKPLSPV